MSESPKPQRPTISLGNIGQKPADGPGEPVSDKQARDRASGRATWHRKASKPVSTWMMALFVVLMTHRWIPSSLWLMVHMITLGLITNSILVWSQHFTEALLKNRLPDSARGEQIRRIYLLNASIVLTMLGIIFNIYPLTLVGSTGVGAMVAWHGYSLFKQVKQALPARFQSTIHFYIAAAWVLPVGAAFGATLDAGLNNQWHARFLLAHEAVNVLGFVGFTVVGTLMTLWPTMLRTKMTADAVTTSKHALYIMSAGVAVVMLGALAGWRWLAFAGLLIYLLALALIAILMVRTCATKKLVEFSTMSVAAGFAWLIVGTVTVSILIATHDFAELNLRPATPMYAVGFLVQVLLGAMSYLLPARMGGGPAAVRAANKEFNRFAAGRVVMVNLCLLLFVLPADWTGSWIRTATSLLGAFTLFAFVPLMLRGVKASVAKRKEMILARSRGEAPKPDPEALTPATAHHRRNIAVGVVAVALVTLLGFAVDPSAVRLPITHHVADSQATGETTTVQVEATSDMRFTPDTVEVPAGNRLVIEVKNTDTENVHDLAFENGAQTGRIDPGQTATVDVGVIDKNLEGWCSIVGHKAMGMVFHVVAVGAEGADSSSSMNHSMSNSAMDSTVMQSSQIDLATAPQNFEARDTLAPITDSEVEDGVTVHRETFDVEEIQQEIAPGTSINAMTYNGKYMGPTLRGKVGDVFEIKLVNNGAMGHSLDFHAGMVSPDPVMKTLAPGESLTYRFEARGAGMWLYHCSTAPMSSHMAAGMFGAVIIEPEDLQPVDREYVLVQNDAYLTDTGEKADNGNVLADVSPEGISAGTPTLTMFNGYANQYVYQPLQAKVGDRVRMWVLAAGPSKGTSFHVVGSQFDTVYKEGAYSLKNGRDAFGTAGHAQALDLSAAQGGFIEMEMQEPGNYAFVNHDFTEAERGAKGILHVSE
ncbi:multicopper oxidase domain-containing protein [Rothia terrae]|uniref:multicopper oxidase domain-containing protein n=1 Tax=Rothia terrae TaxID=396015 RepID=UPI0038168E2A